MKSVIRLALIVGLTLSSAPAWALFESDRELSDKARITMIEALKTAQKKAPNCRNEGRLQQLLATNA